MSDAFKDRLSQRAFDTSRPALAHQSLGRELSEAETEFAKVLMEVYGEGVHDFDAVAQELTKRGAVAPVSGSTEWSKTLLESELATINASLDEAYEANGYGA